MSNLMFFDSTLRDGSHAIKHQLRKDQIANYCKNIDSAGVEVVIVGHGNGLGASSLQVGRSLLSDREMIETARANLINTKLGSFFIPGFATIKDDLKPALDMGVDLVCVASHCTEADITQQYIEYIAEQKRDVYGVLMMYHMTSGDTLLEEALKMQNYGAKGIIVMDSAGTSTPEMVKTTIKLLVDYLDIPVGFHAHNNLGLSVANSYLAIKYGATIIDGTVRGFGAGAGNCPLEVFAGLLYKDGIKTKLDFYKLIEISDNIVANFMLKPQEISGMSLASGLAGVFSGFAVHVKNAGTMFNVSPVDIFLELGKRKVVGGQEDIIIEVAKYLAEKQNIDQTVYEIENLC